MADGSGALAPPLPPGRHRSNTREMDLSGGGGGGDGGRGGGNSDAEAMPWGRLVTLNRKNKHIKL